MKIRPARHHCRPWNPTIVRLACALVLFLNLSPGHTQAPESAAPPATAQVAAVEAERTQRVAGGYGHGFTIASDGGLWAWGANERGQLGDGTRTDRLTPVQVLTGGTAVAAGQLHTLALKTDGSLWAWGHNAYGQLGDGTTTDRASPVQVLTGVKAVTSAWYHTLALKTDATLWAWGLNCCD